MISNRSCTISIALACATLSAVAAPTAYQLVDLGDHLPVAINNNGDIAAERNGFAESYANGVWTRLPHHGNTQAQAINSNGDIVGEDGDQAVRWHDGHLKSLNGVTVGSEAYGIADDGTIAGTRVVRKTEACYSWRKGKAKDLGTLGTRCEAYGIDPTGQFIGGVSLTDFGAFHGFIHDAQGMHDLGVLSGGENSQVQAVNSQGHAAAAADYDQSGLLTAAYWDGQELVEVPGVNANGVQAFGAAINTSDEMVVVGDDGAGDHLFLYEGSNGVVTALEPLIQNAEGWCFCRDRYASISDDGHIVGTAYVNSVAHGFMLVPVDH
jgi:probable HAF family extracellular repeat protein